MPWGPIKQHGGKGVPPEVDGHLTRMFFDSDDKPGRKKTIEEIVQTSRWSAHEKRFNSWIWGSLGWAPITRYQVFRSAEAEKLMNSVREEETV